MFPSDLVFNFCITILFVMFPDLGFEHRGELPLIQQLSHLLSDVFFPRIAMVAYGGRFKAPVVPKPGQYLVSGLVFSHSLLPVFPLIA